MPNPPKPTKLKKLQGTHRSDRDVENPLGDVLEVITTPEPPNSLDVHGANEWLIVCKRLESVGLLHDVSLGIIEAYCLNKQFMLEAQRDLEDQGKYIYNEKGEQKLNPAWRIFMDASKEMRAIAIQFGFTPSSASKLPLPDNTKPNAFQRLKQKSGQ